MPPYSVDESPEFSDQELTNIIQMWRAVAEDYAAWDVSCGFGAVCWVTPQPWPAAECVTAVQEDCAAWDVSMQLGGGFSIDQ